MASTTVTQENKMAERIRQSLSVQEIGVIFILILMALFFDFVTKGKFLTADNIFSMMRAFSWIAVTGFGELLVIIIDGIDLSVGSSMGLIGIITGMAIVGHGLPIWVGILVGIVCALLIGLMNGLLVSKGKLPAFIATLGTMSIGRGLCYGFTNGQPIQNFPKAFTFLGRSDLPIPGLERGVPLPVVFMLVLAIIMGLFLSRTVWGYRIYALGGNEQATELSGVNTSWIKILVFSVGGLLAGWGGMMMTARLGVADPNGALGYELDVIAAVFIGGASTSGGSGTILGVLIGAAIMQILRTGLVIVGFPAYWQSAAIGLVIIFALLLDQLRKQRQR